MEDKGCTFPSLLWARAVWEYSDKGVFTFFQTQVPNGSSPDLMISPVQLKDAGFYICRVHSGDAFEFSQWAQVDVLNAGMSYGKIVFESCLWQSRWDLEITVLFSFWLWFFLLIVLFTEPTCDKWFEKKCCVNKCTVLVTDKAEYFTCLHHAFAVPHHQDKAITP